jgi:hypothetical protein
VANVGRAYAILRGRLTGDPESAKKYLEGMSPEKRREAGQAASRLQGRAKKMYKPGRRTRRAERASRRA